MADTRVMLLTATAGRVVGEEAGGVGRAHLAGRRLALWHCGSG